jgi:hypothetical protein
VVFRTISLNDNTGRYQVSKLNDVNTTDLRDAIRMGCRTMCSVFNSDDDGVPFFGSQVLPEAYLSFSWAHSEAHVPGRHLNALLNAEDAIGIEIDEESIDAHARAAFLSYSGPVPLPLNRDKIGGELLHFIPHNIREGFHALTALAQYRSSARACDLIEASVETILKCWNPVNTWDYDYIESTYGLNVFRAGFIVGLARTIGPLVKAYRVTGSDAVLQLAILLKDKAISEYFTEDGTYDHTTFGTHAHSVTCVLSSLAQLAELTTDAALMERVRAFYDNGLWDLRDGIGWSPEKSSDEGDPDRGEANNTGDIVETALILGRKGYSEYFEDAERILRCHLLPSQLRDISFIPGSPDNPTEDGRRDVARRHLGAFGFPAPYGHRPIGWESVGFNMDIVGGATASLCEAYRDTVRLDDSCYRVNMLFDYDAPEIAVESPYTHDCLRVRVRRDRPLHIRIPTWVAPETVSVDAVRGTPRISDGYLILSNPPLDQWISIRFPLARRTITLEHRTRNIRTQLRGDEVIGMDNFGADLTFFDPIGQE